MPTATLLAVLRSGGRYDAPWAERLFAGARRHAPEFARHALLTDLPLALPRVATIPLRHAWPAWWSKLEAFRAGLFAGPVVLLDLDTVFAGPADALADVPACVSAMEDFFHKGRLSSAVLRWHDDALAFVYATFAADPERWMAPGSCGTVPNAVHGDQVVIDHLLRRDAVPVRFVQHDHPGLLDFYAPAKTAYGPVVIFIGEAKPDGAGEPIASLWRGASPPGALGIP